MLKIAMNIKTVPADSHPSNPKEEVLPGRLLIGDARSGSGLLLRT
jgi:hypothetical protein